MRTTRCSDIASSSADLMVREEGEAALTQTRPASSSALALVLGSRTSTIFRIPAAARSA